MFKQQQKMSYLVHFNVSMETLLIKLLIYIEAHFYLTDKKIEIFNKIEQLYV